MERDKIIVRTSVIGILVNLILVAFKASIGIMVNSIAITLDAVNNLTDALSSIITIIGTNYCQLLVIIVRKSHQRWQKRLFLSANLQVR